MTPTAPITATPDLKPLPTLNASDSPQSVVYTFTDDALIANAIYGPFRTDNDAWEWADDNLNPRDISWYVKAVTPVEASA